MKDKERPILSISLLVSNRIDTITKCMESIKPLLERLPCELIAVDTVGEENTDGSIQVVRQYTDKIYRFEWCNDFAAARNCGFEKCTGEWFMFLDDDEWFEDVSEIIEFFTSGEYKNYSCALYKIHNYIDREGKFSSISSVFRMIRKEKGTQFVGRIHEHLIPFQAPAKEFSAYVHHYGYVFNSEEEKRRHSERNISLLRCELKQRPGSLHMRAQMVQEYIFLEELIEEAEKLCEDTFRASETSYENANFQWILMAYVRCAAAKKNAALVIERAEQIRNRFPLNALADYAISYMELEACNWINQYELGIRIFNNALEKRAFVLQNPEKKQKMFALDIENFLNEDIYCELLRWGIYCNRKLGNKERVEELLKEYFHKETEPVLSVFVLVSNRITTIRKCMESIHPLLESIPSELIVVDTVGEEKSDGSLAVAREYATRVVSYMWDDDFAAARNVALEVAKGHWVLYLDDDEWFEDTREIQRFFLNGEYLEYNSATYLVRNYKDKVGTNYSIGAVGRMVRLRSTTTFVGCISETFSNIYSPVKQLSDYVHHYGYVYDSAEERKEHLEYVRLLLEKDLIKYPDNLKNRARLTAILAIENPERALEVCLDTIELCAEKFHNSQYQGQIALLFELFEKLQINRQTVWEQYQKFQTSEKMMPMTEQAVCYKVTRIFVMQEAYLEAYSCAKRYFFLEGMLKEQQDIPKEIKKYQTTECREEMIVLGGFCAWQVKKYEDAWECYEAMSWETAGVEAEETMWQMFTMAEEYTNADVLFRLIKRFMADVGLKTVLAKLIQNPVVKEKINQTLALQREKHK